MEHSKVFSMVSFCILPTPKRHQRVRQALHWGSEGRTTELEKLLAILLIRLEPAQEEVSSVRLLVFLGKQ